MDPQPVVTAAPIVGANSMGTRRAWRSFQAPISRSASSKTRASAAHRAAPLHVTPHRLICRIIERHAPAP
jgi:hypothetical protein